MDEVEVVYEKNWYCSVDNTPCNGICRKVNGKTCKEQVTEKAALGEKAYNRKHGIRKQREEYY